VMRRKAKCPVCKKNVPRGLAASMIARRPHMIECPNCSTALRFSGRSQILAFLFIVLGFALEIPLIGIIRAYEDSILVMVGFLPMIL
jgi:hypothetical protein